MFKDKNSRDRAEAQPPSAGENLWGGVPEDSKFFRCIVCGHVWPGQAISSCPKCGKDQVTQCSAFVYEKYIDRNGFAGQ